MTGATRAAAPRAPASIDDHVRRALLGVFALGLAASITLAQAALALLAARLAWRVLRGRARLGGWPLAVPVAAWAAASLLAALASDRPATAFESAVRGLALVAAFYVVLDAVTDVRAADRWLFLVFALVAAAGLVGMLQVALCPVLDPLAPSVAGLGPLRRVLTGCHRAHAFYSIYMTLAGVLSLVLLATLPRLLPGGGAGRGWIAAWLAGGGGLAMTYVRGAWVGFVAGAAVLLALVRGRRVLLVAAVVALALLVVAVPGVRRRAESIVDPADPTARERWAMWRSAAAIARDHPLTGVGPGQVKHVYAAYAAPEFRGKPRGHVHDTPLQILIERGVLGLAAWLGLFAAFFVHAGRTLARLPPAAVRERALVSGAIAAIAGFLVGGLTEYNFGDSEVVLLAYALMAVPFVVRRELDAASVVHAAARGRQLRDDARRAVRAGRTLWRHLRSREQVDVGLGGFSAAAPRVTPGQPQRYVLSIASARGETCDLTVRLDVFASPGPPDGHYARVTKRVAVAPRSLCRIEVHYDWLTTARLVVDGETCAPDAVWRGAVRLAPRCAVRAALGDGGGRDLDELTIYQEVAG